MLKCVDVFVRKMKNSYKMLRDATRILIKSVGDARLTDHGYEHGARRWLFIKTFCCKNEKKYVHFFKLLLTLSELKVFILKN